MKQNLLSVLATLSLAAMTAQAFEPTWLPGGDDVKAAVAARRGKTELSKLALSMKPGTWAEVPVVGPGGLRFQAGDVKKSRGLDLGTWSDDGAWDTRTGQFLYLGLRKNRRFFAYSEDRNEWREIKLPEDHEAANSPHIHSQFGHQYSRNALDPEQSVYYTMVHAPGAIHRYDIRAETWAKLPPGGNCNGYGLITFFSARNGLLNMGQHKPIGELFLFGEEKQSWESLGKTVINGYCALARHNPYRGEVLLAGGIGTVRNVVRVKADGKFERLKDAPHILSILNTKLTVDPLSGRYLIMSTPKAGGRFLYEFDSDQNEYRLLDDFSKTPWPFENYASPLVADLPEHGVTMWVTKKTMLYKHNPDGVEPKLAPETMARKLSWNSAVAGGTVTAGSPIPQTFIGIHPGQDAGTESTNAWARVIPMNLQTGEFSLLIDGLTPQQDYVVRAYAVNRVGNAWSEPKRITTDSAPPKVAQLTLDGDQQLDGEVPAIAFRETPDHPLYAFGSSPNWLYKFADYGDAPTQLHLGEHKLFSDHEQQGGLALDLNKGALIGKGEVAIRTYRGSNSHASSIVITNVGDIAMGGIDTHAEWTQRNSDWHAGSIDIGTPDNRAGTMRIGYLHAYATGIRAGSADITLYGSGDVIIGTSEKPGDIRTDALAWHGGDILIDHMGGFSVGAILADTGGNRHNSPRPGRIVLNGNNSSGDATIQRIVARNHRSIGRDHGRQKPISIANYRHVTIGDIDGSYPGDGPRPVADLDIKTGITGNIVVTGKLDLGSSYQDKDRQNAVHCGVARLVCQGTVTLAELDLDRVRYILMDSGSGASVVRGAIAHFETADATGAGTANDPKVSKETRLRAPAGQTVRYKADGVNEALGGYVWQLRNAKGDGPGGALMPQ